MAQLHDAYSFVSLPDGMKPVLFSILWILLSVAQPVAAAPADCPVPGMAIHWIADYCMSSLETDDEIPAGSCISKESRIAFKNECAAKWHYKKKMCMLAISRATINGSVQNCLADPDFVGPVVRNGGIGG